MARKKANIYKSSRGVVLPGPKSKPARVNDLPAPLLFVLGVGGFALGFHLMKKIGSSPRVEGFRPHV